MGQGMLVVLELRTICNWLLGALRRVHHGRCIDLWTRRSRLRYDVFMPRKPNPLHSAIQEAVRGAIADDARAVERKARQEARRQEREADAALAKADPQAPQRERLSQIDEQLAGLRQAHQQKGDALAGRLIETLERERAQLLAKLGR